MDIPSEPFIHRLPSELLAHIFILQHYDSLDLGHNKAPTPFISPSTHKSPLALLPVCRRWHHTVAQTPELWASVKIAFKAPPRADEEGAGLQRWLERAGTYPLAVAFTSRAVYPSNLVDANKDKDVLREALELIAPLVAPHISRCRTLTIGLPPPFAQLFADLFGNGDGMPLLESLSLVTPPKSSLTLIDLTKCPRLTKIRVSTSYEFHPRLHLGQNPAFPNLREVDSTDNMDQSWQILANAPAVVKASLLFRHPIDTSLSLAPESHTLRLSKLTKLEISTSSRVDPRLFYARLWVPGLRELDVDFGSEVPNNGDVDWPYLSDMLRGSRPPLESLTLSNFPGTPLDVLRVLQLVPGLKSLNVTQIQAGDWLWLALTDGDEPGPLARPIDYQVTLWGHERRFLSTHDCLCPDLEKLHIRFGGEQNPLLVATMVTSRYRRVTRGPLKSLSLFACGFEREMLVSLPGVDACVADGLELDVQSTWGWGL